ncbi:Hypothetical predicted protein [Scomber scombrus]|uniref:Uncharacterized protein n=1 Tax=Scomber scombrus TaxID=13677 RepID=A0AAV1PGN5_SCOSC
MKRKESGGSPRLLHFTIITTRLQDEVLNQVGYTREDDKGGLKVFFKMALKPERRERERGERERERRRRRRKRKRKKEDRGFQVPVLGGTFAAVPGDSRGIQKKRKRDWSSLTFSGPCADLSSSVPALCTARPTGNSSERNPKPKKEDELGISSGPLLTLAVLLQGFVIIEMFSIEKASFSQSSRYSDLFGTEQNYRGGKEKKKKNTTTTTTTTTKKKQMAGRHSSSVQSDENVSNSEAIIHVKPSLNASSENLLQLVFWKWINQLIDNKSR